MFGLGISEILLVLAVALLVLGPKKLPEAARSLGRLTGYLRRTMDEVRHDITIADYDLKGDLLKSCDDSEATQPPQIPRELAAPATSSEENVSASNDSTVTTTDNQGDTDAEKIR